MSEEKIAHKRSLEFSWKEIIQKSRKLIENDLYEIQDRHLRSFYSQIILNRIFLITIFWQKSLLFLGSKGLWQEDFHNKVMIPFLKKLSGLSADDNEILKEGCFSVPDQKSLLFPIGGVGSLSDIQVDDGTYSDIFRRINSQIDGFGAMALKDLFESEMLGEMLEFSLTRAKKKAKGIFYTPQYITDEMASLAIREFLISHLKKQGIDPSALQNKHPGILNAKTSKALKNILLNLKILDNAVGCGEYLLSALKIIVSFYERCFSLQFAEKEILERQSIRIEALSAALAYNLYGVDISPIAVDTCKTRLWGYFLLELENGQSPLFLPDLDSRIRLGNSLIGFPLPPTMYKSRNQDISCNNSFTNECYALNLSKLGFSVSKEDLISLAAFHWQTEFPYVFENSENGKSDFAIIIGNPPFQSTKRSFFSNIEKETYKVLFQFASRQWDIYELFVERSLSLLQPNGFLCYLLPKPFLTNENMEPLRKMLLNEAKVLEIIDVGAPFQDAGVELVIVLISTSDDVIDAMTEIGFLDKTQGVVGHHKVPQTAFKEFPSHRFAIGLTELEIEIIRKIKSRCSPLSKITSKLTRGIECGKKDPLINQKGEGSPLIRGEDVTRYRTTFNNHFIHFQNDEPSIFKGLSLYQGQKILLRRVASGIVAAEEREEKLFLNTLYGLKIKEKISLSFLLAILNSKMLNWWFNRVFFFEENLFPYVRKSQLLELPIRLSLGTSLATKGITLYERYERVIGLLADLIQILMAQNEANLCRILDEEILDPLVFEFYFCEELDTGLLAAVETGLLKFSHYSGSSIIASEIRELLEDSSIWTALQNAASHIARNEIFSASIGSEKFRKAWRKIHRN
ncbi:MAG: Eco57I restriction-modification methylase domain-containing protein [Candidatus Hodarchaeota archaeon]